MKKVQVKLSNETSDIYIEKKILSKINSYTLKYFDPNITKKAIILYDEKMIKYGYLNIIKSQLEKYYSVFVFEVKSGEQSKSISNYANLIEKILAIKPSRKDFLIALGGGVIGDLTGFIASTINRGIPFVQIPTTLLAQVDSSVGGKTAINSQYGKNLIGTFYQPKLVLIDPTTLLTLDERNLKSGYVEAIKCGIIGNQKFYEWCLKNCSKILKKDLNSLENLIYESIKFKAKIVSLDPKETKGVRILLNLGHSFAHAYEKLTNFNPKKLLHGEAVGIGLIQALQLSEQLGYAKNISKILIDHFKNNKILTYNDFLKQNKVKPEQIVENMKNDKKNIAGTINLVLNTKIGKSFLCKNVATKNIIKILI